MQRIFSFRVERGNYNLVTSSRIPCNSLALSNANYKAITDDIILKALADFP